MAITKVVATGFKGKGVEINDLKVVGEQVAAIVSLTDSTTGAVTNTLDDTTASVKDDIASLAAKLQEVIVVLRNHGLIAT